MLHETWINLKTTVLPTDCCTDNSEADEQVYGNLSSDKKRSCQVDIKLERKCSIIKYHVEEREETDLKARILYRLCWRRHVL